MKPTIEGALSGGIHTDRHLKVTNTPIKTLLAGIDKSRMEALTATDLKLSSLLISTNSFDLFLLFLLLFSPLYHLDNLNVIQHQVCCFILLKCIYQIGNGHGVSKKRIMRASCNSHSTICSYWSDTEGKAEDTNSPVSLKQFATVAAEISSHTILPQSISGRSAARTCRC